MPFSILNQEVNVSKNGSLAIALYRNQLRSDPDGKPSWYARVVNRSRLGMDDIADDMASNGVQALGGGRLSAAEITHVWRQINNAVLARMSEGITVDMGLGTLRAAVTGPFGSRHDSFDPERNAITALYRPGSMVTNELAALRPVVTQGNSSGPEISSVTDITGTDSGILSPGHLLEVRGKNVCVATDAAGDACGVYFENRDDPADVVRLGAQDIEYNHASVLHFTLPAALKAGATYCIRVATRYCGATHFRKDVAEDTYAIPFTVAG